MNLLRREAQGETGRYGEGVTQLLQTELIDLMESDEFQAHVPQELKDHLAYKLGQVDRGTYTAFDAGYARNALIAAAEGMAATPGTPDEQVEAATRLAKQLSGST